MNKLILLSPFLILIGTPFAMALHTTRYDDNFRVMGNGTIIDYTWESSGVAQGEKAALHGNETGGDS